MYTCSLRVRAPLWNIVYFVADKQQLQYEVDLCSSLRGLTPYDETVFVIILGERIQWLSLNRHRKSIILVYCFYYVRIVSSKKCHYYLRTLSLFRIEYPIYFHVHLNVISISCFKIMLLLLGNNASTKPLQ